MKGGIAVPREGGSAFRLRRPSSVARSATKYMLLVRAKIVLKHVKQPDQFSIIKQSFVWFE